MILYLITGCCFFTYVLLKNGCSLIHVHWAIPTGLIGVIIGGLLRKPVLVTIHGSDFRMGTERSTFLRKLFFFVCKKAKHLSCVSEVMRREIEHNGIQREKISTFPMGIDEAFSEIGRNREKKARSQKCTILSNRNLLSIYNVSLLIRAIPFILSQEPDTRFVIAGDGPEREKLEQEAGNLRISSSVQFLGNIPHDKMANLLGQADIYVSTSLSDGTSVSLLEAMGSGAFPVVTDIPANREWIISGQNGYLVPVDEEKVLANRIIDAIRNQALLRKSRIENLSIVEKKALWPVSIWKIKEIYSQVLK
jgi:glycosyltransferase involved in cell wall biosynthesis